jgi:hypothetical protein
MIPGLSLDGGQVLKAIVWQITGNRFQGVRWAAKTGTVLGWLAVGWGMILILLTRELWGGLWIAFIGSFILRNANAYSQLANLQETLLKIVAVDAMTRDFRVVDGDKTLRQFADEYILADTKTGESGHQVFPYYAASNGRYRGLVCAEDLQFIERSRWEAETLQTIVRSLDQIATVQEKTPIVEVINCLEEKELRRVTVLSPAGTVAGIIDRGDIVRAVAQKLNLPIPEAEIKRIKAEGSYPPSFQLQAIAKSTIL